MKRWLVMLFLLAALAGCSPASAPIVQTVTPVAIEATAAQTPQTTQEASPAPINADAATAVPVTPDVASDISLPAPIYYLLEADGNPRALYRLETDTVTNTLISDVPEDVASFSVNPVNGDVAFAAGNSLYHTGPMGEDPRVLIEGAQGEETEEFVLKEKIGRPVWSPDGKQLAYTRGGLMLLELDSMTSTMLLENQLEQMPSGGVLIREIYAANRWNADGTKLILDVGYYEGGTIGIYDLTARRLIMPHTESWLCCQTSWSSDGTSVYVSSPFIGMIEPGLWQIDAGTGEVTVLAEQTSEAFPFVGWAEENPEGTLNYFYNSVLLPPDDGTLALAPYQSPVLDFEDQTQTSQQTYRLREVLWAPDHELAVGLGYSDSLYGENLYLITTTDLPAVVLPFEGSFIAWGKP